MSRTLRYVLTVVLLAALLGPPSTSLATTLDQGDAERPGPPAAWFLAAWDNLVAFVAGDGLGSDEEGESEGDVGPGLDPNG